MTTDTSERGLERLICTALTGAPCLSAEASAKAGGPGTVRAGVVHERPAACGAGWIPRASGAYDREYDMDVAQVSVFLRETQPEEADASREHSESRDPTATRVGAYWAEGRARDAVRKLRSRVEKRRSKASPLSQLFKRLRLKPLLRRVVAAPSSKAPSKARSEGALPGPPRRLLDGAPPDNSSVVPPLATTLWKTRGCR